MTQELFINDIKVELDSETRIDLQYKSFLFTGISTVEGSRSWTVSLPKSSINLKTIQNIHSSDTDSIFPYRSYSVNYYEDGFRIINAGKAVLIRISERIEFCLTWGGMVDTLKLLGTKKLVELAEEADETLTWDRSIVFNDITDGFGWCNWYSFTNEDRSYDPAIGHADIPFKVVHPVVMFWWILTKIANEFSLDLSSLINYFISGGDYYIGSPLKKTDGVSLFSNVESSSATGLPASIPDLTRVYFNTASSIYFSLVDKCYFIKKDYESELFVDNMNFSKDIRATVNAVTIEIYLCTLDSSNTEIEIKKLDKSITDTTLCHFTLTDYSFSLSKGDSKFYFKLVNYVSGTIYVPALTFDSYSNKAIYSATSADNGFFPIIPNLPDMTCADFIFQCMQMAGVFPQINELDNTIIDFFSAKTIYDNIPNAVDWSDKLIKKTDRYSELENVAFKFGSYAKRNTLTYKGGDLSTTVEASLNVDNENLEDTSKLVELKFAAGKRFSSNNPIVDYPLYDIKIVSGALETTSKDQSDDIIANVISVSGTNTLVFSSWIQFANIIDSENYTKYQDLIKYPRYITENFYLKPQDIANLSLKVPIYLRQYGKYYAIMNLNYSKDNSTCELLEVKNI